jgi:flagellin-like hook-associated protein FlgL
MGTPAAGDFSITINAKDDAEVFDPTQVYAAGARVLEQETGGTGGNHLNAAGSTHPLDNDSDQFITYSFDKKFWGDGSTISALDQAAAGDLVFSGGQIWEAQNNVSSFNPSDVNFATDWNGTTKSTLMELEFSGLSFGGVSIPAGPANAGAFIARADGASVIHQYNADKIGIQVVSEGVTYTKQVDYISGANADQSKELSAAALVEAINSDTTGIGAIVFAEVINTFEIKLTAQASGIPFTTTKIAIDDHTSTNATHNLPLDNGFPGTTAVADLTINTTKEIEAPTAPGASASSATGYSIFKPASDWGIKEWDSSYPHQNGSLVWNVNSGTGNPEIWELGTNVKGFWNGGTVQSGEIFLHNGSWFQAQSDNLTETPDSSSLNWTLVDPLLVGATDVTADYMDLSNTNLWSKTHFGNLIGTTIEQDYVRGDNFFYEGKHYVYVSSSPSSDYKYDPTQTGLTEFEVLLEEGAVMELPIYVDTVGRGGSPDLPEGVYYKPNQNLEYIDRLPDSGLVRTNSIERRGEPSDSDNIYNSNDDLYYGGLNPGADGIYGTNDDVYATTRYSEFAKAGGHIDSDADNNKDLLNESNNLTDFSVMDFVDFIQTIANFRAINGGSMSRLEYAGRMLAENRSNLEAAYGRIMDADIAMESSRFAKHNVMVQASASMVAQANQLTNVALTLLGR